jgi:hypothetical protein
MKVRLISFGTRNYRNNLVRLRRQAEQLGVFDGGIHMYTEEDLPKMMSFWEKHGKFVQNNPRGYGYWIWKPFLVQKVMREADSDDIVFYCDAGCDINPEARDRMSEYIEMLRSDPSGILSFQITDQVEKKWSKMDLVKILCAEQEVDSNMLMATIFAVRNIPRARYVIQRWCDTVSSYHMIDDSPSRVPEDPEFREHRHDQSVFSLLRKKEGSIVIPDETYPPGRNCCPIWTSRRVNT